MDGGAGDVLGVGVRGEEEEDAAGEVLERMDGLIPWKELEDAIRPHYPKAGGAGRGRRPYPLSAMLRVHCVQLFYNASDPGMEDMLYEVAVAHHQSAAREPAKWKQQELLAHGRVQASHSTGKARRW